MRERKRVRRRRREITPKRRPKILKEMAQRVAEVEREEPRVGAKRELVIAAGEAVPVRPLPVSNPRVVRRLRKIIARRRRAR